MIMLETHSQVRPVLKFMSMDDREEVSASILQATAAAQQAAAQPSGSSAAPAGTAPSAAAAAADNQSATQLGQRLTSEQRQAILIENRWANFCAYPTASCAQPGCQHAYRSGSIPPHPMLIYKLHGHPTMMVHCSWLIPSVPHCPGAAWSTLVRRASVAPGLHTIHVQYTTQPSRMLQVVMGCENICVPPAGHLLVSTRPWWLMARL